jgi:hypothetical protein
MQHLSTIELLDRAKDVTGSDSATARAIDLPIPHIFNIRAGTRRLSSGQAGVLAELCGLPWAWVVANIELEKETRPAIREFWQKKYEPLAQGA